jgi:hypothetical protein
MQRYAALHRQSIATVEVCMNRLLWLLIPLAASAHPLRYARLGEFDGAAEVRIQAADAWQPALRNTPLPQGARVQTPAASHAEIELDQGSVLRLAPETLVELSDYTRLSGGQRVTLVSLDHGLAYFTGQAGRQEALMLALAGAQVTVDRGARVRIEARDNWSQISVVEGRVRFSSPSAEMDLTEGEMARVDPANRAKFYLYREISPYDSDQWSEQRDKLLASPTSAAHLTDLHYGVQDLDGSGSWIDTETYGTVWKPKAADGWMPFRDGKWAWYDDLGYTWVASETWGWLPYHYGRWMRNGDLGWFWVPGRSRVFKPGEVYWLQGAKVAGWGPMAPGEDWSGMPQLFLNAHTAWADFTAGARSIDPAGFTARPKEPLAVASFTAALPSPPFPAARLDVVASPLRSGAVRILPVISGVAYEDVQNISQAPPPPQSGPPPDTPPSGAPPVVVPPADPPVDVLYPVPVYTGVVVINPPESTHSGEGSGRRHQNTGNTVTSPPPGRTMPEPKRGPEHRPIAPPGGQRTHERPVVNVPVHQEEHPEHPAVAPVQRQGRAGGAEKADRVELTGSPRKN